MYEETQREPSHTQFEIYIYDKSTSKYSIGSIGSASGRDSYEACANFIIETGWKSETSSKILYAKHPVCR